MPMELSEFEQLLLDHLAQIEWKAEIVDNRLVIEIMPSWDHAFASGEIFVSMRAHVRRARLPGRPAGDGLDYKVRLPRRLTFRPDVSFYDGPPTGMKLPERAPRFAVEVRSESDRGAGGVELMRRKREDYFEAGTLVVWDVDLEGVEIVRVFRDGNAQTPAVVYGRGELAEAEPAVPGWTMPVDDLFDPAAGAGA